MEVGFCFGVDTSHGYFLCFSVRVAIAGARFVVGGFSRK